MDADDIVFSQTGDWGKLRWGVVYDERPRTWRERLFSWPWRPWIKDRPPVAVIDFRTPPDE